MNFYYMMWKKFVVIIKNNIKMSVFDLYSSVLRFKSWVINDIVWCLCLLLLSYLNLDNG